MTHFSICLCVLGATVYSVDIKSTFLLKDGEYSECVEGAEEAIKKSSVIITGVAIVMIFVVPEAVIREHFLRTVSLPHALRAGVTVSIFAAK